MGETWFPYGLIYGPHSSRRLGLSLGVDLTPMSCTFNCVFCERGATLFGCISPSDFTSKVDLEVFLDVLQQSVNGLRFDCLTFSGTGEPTLESKLGKFITSSREIIGPMPIRVITNASLMTNESVVQNISEADEVIVKLNAVSEDAFVEMHRPFDQTLKPERIIRGIHLLKQEIGSSLVVEILFIRSFQLPKTNSTKDEVVKLSEVLRCLEPATIQVHTISRVPAEPYVLPVDNRFLDKASASIKNTLPQTHVSTYMY